MFDPWVYKGLCCLGLFVLAYACMHSSRTWVRRVGWWLIFLTMGVLVWFVTESLFFAGVGLLGWFLIPLGQAIYLSRRLRFSLSRRLIKERQEIEDFEDWSNLSDDLREAGFDLDGEYGLKPSPVDYGFRLFRHREKNLVAGLGLIRQGGLSLTYVFLMTRAGDGSIWLTWDYPLPYALKMPPNINVFRCLEAASVQELSQQHEEFMALNEVVASTQRAEPQELCDAMFGDTMRYNLNIGLLRSSEESSEEIFYSWRGTLFITWQALRDMVGG